MKPERNTKGNHAYGFKEKTNGHTPASLYHLRLPNEEIHATHEEQNQILSTKYRGEKRYKCERKTGNSLGKQYLKIA